MMLDDLGYTISIKIDSNLRGCKYSNHFLDVRILLMYSKAPPAAISVGVCSKYSSSIFIGETEFFLFLIQSMQ